MLSPGVIAGIVSFCLLHAFEYVLDLLSARTNGAFGTTTPSIQPDHAINPKDSAHDGAVGGRPNGKAAVADEEVRILTDPPYNHARARSLHWLRARTAGSHKHAGMHCGISNLSVRSFAVDL